MKRVNTTVEEQKSGIPPQSYAMSWEDIRATFPYGLPASLRRGSWRWFRSPNVIDLEEWRRSHVKGRHA
jgi:hypothetical protein